MTQIVELVNKHIKSYYNCILYVQEVRGKTKHDGRDVKNIKKIPKLNL